jgi:hypothetical protein
VIDHTACKSVLRARLLTLSVCTTGVISLSATGTGYARSAGSFLTDGFKPGQEVNAAGFGTGANNGLSVITAVTDLTMDVQKTPATVVEGAAGGRALSVGLPSARIWQNVPTEPPTGAPYIEETYLHGPVTLRTIGPGGLLEGLPQYVIRVYGLTDLIVGDESIAKYADAILALFAAKTAIAVGVDVLRVRGDPAPFSSEIRPASAGWAVVTVTMPLRIETANSL